MTKTTTIDVRWYDDGNRILLWTFGQNWSIQDLRDAFIESIPMIEAQPHEVCIVLDGSRSTAMPKHTLTELCRWHRRAPHNYEASVMIPASLKGRLLVNMLNAMPWSGDRYQLAESVDEAVAM